MGTAVACCEPSEEIHTSAEKGRQSLSATDDQPTTIPIADFSESLNLNDQDVNLEVGAKQDKVAASSSENKEVVDTEPQATNLAEDEEETKGEALVAFTEEERNHEDFTKFYRRF